MNLSDFKIAFYEAQRAVSLARTRSLVLACGGLNGIFTLRTILTSMNQVYAIDLIFAMDLVLAFLNVLEIETCLERG